MAIKTYRPFSTGYRLIDGSKLNSLFQGNEQMQAINTPKATIAALSASSMTQSATDGITAHVGGGQANATPLPSTLNRVTTVASAADSVVLPASAVGLQITVQNSGANSLQLFGLGADTVDGNAAATGVAVAANKTAVLTCFTAGAWIGPVAEA